MKLDQKERWLLLLFIAVNMLTAIFAELNNDETYYWYYSRQLDWGYYDHPPMVALFIKIGYALLQTDLGVRLLTLVASTVAAVLLLGCIPKEYRRKGWLFLILIFATPGLQIYSFITTPDVPLLLFSILFLYLYKQEYKSLIFKSLLLAFTGALMFYSKYHGAIFVVFIVLANFKSLTHWFWYLTGLFTLLLVLPHIYWQYQNDWPSILYHLVERNKVVFRLEYPISFIVNQFVYFNPFFLAMGLYWVMTKKVKIYQNNFERTLAVVTLLFWLFFGARIFKGHVEPQWTLLGIPCFLLLFFRYTMELKAEKKVLRMAWVSIGLLTIARIIIMFDIIPVKNQFHGSYSKMEKLEQKAGDLPVLFVNTYQDPSKYTYLTGKEAQSLNGTSYRTSHYDLRDDWKCDWNGQKVFWVNSVVGEKLDVPGFHHTLRYEIDTFRVKYLKLASLDKRDDAFKAVLTNECAMNYNFDWESGTDKLVLMYYHLDKWFTRPVQILDSPRQMAGHSKAAIYFALTDEAFPPDVRVRICYQYKNYPAYTLGSIAIE